AVASPLLAEIRALTRDRDRLLETQQATEAQLRAILEAYHPAPVRLFSSVDRQITLSFITDYPTPAAASRLRTARIAGFCKRNSYTGRVPAQVLAERLRANLLSGAEGTVAGKSFSAQSFTRLLTLLNEQLAEFDDAIAAAVAEHPDAAIFASFPGVGPVLTGVLLAEIGEDRTRFPRPEVLLAEAGLAPVTRASGRSRSVRFRYAANGRLREAAMWWAFNSLKVSPWAAHAFRVARDERGQRYHRALRGLAARWTRILWRCWHDGTTYDPGKHLSAATADAASAARGSATNGTRSAEPTSSARPDPTASSCPRLAVGVCGVHSLRNRLTRVPKSAQPMVATLVRTIFEQPDAEQGWAQHA